MNIYLKLQQPERWQELKKREWQGGEEEARSKLELRGGGKESSLAASVRVAKRAETWRTQQQQRRKARYIKPALLRESALPSAVLPLCVSGR
jgi:hypothetical protein